MSQHIHFIGIGGIGMSGIAKLYLRHKAIVSGSDLKESKITQELRQLGANIQIGHSSLNVKDADLVVFSSAIKEDNPEIIAAKAQGIPLIKRAQALAQLMKDKTVITVTGSHGKTTTTSLVSCLLLEAGLFPTAAIGGILINIDNNAYLGDGEFFVAEADESDGSFLYYQPKYSIITNIDYEHLDYYGEFKNVLSAYREFLNKTAKDGCAFCCDDDINLKEILRNYKNRYITFGLKDTADIYPKNIKMQYLNCEFDVYYKNKFIDKFYLALGGLHNISNSLSVIALGFELKLNLDIIKRTLINYKGARRRLEVKFKDEKYIVIDDYAHHPTEIKATLLTVRNLKSNRIVAVFQPHRYTRTKLLLDEFGTCFDAADYIVITDIYSAGELPIKGIDATCIYNKLIKNYHDKPIYLLPKEKITPYILEIIKPGDLVITLGAGDITKICDELVQELKR